MEIQWRRVIDKATRIAVAHGYSGIDDDIIWDIIQTGVPKLLPALRDLLNTTSGDAA